MANDKRTLPETITARSDMAVVVPVIGIIAVLVLPIPPRLIDFALTFNIAFSIVVLIANGRDAT